MLFLGCVNFFRACLLVGNREYLGARSPLASRCLDILISCLEGLEGWLATAGQGPSGSLKVRSEAILG